MNGKLFLSHAHQDKADVQTLRRALEDSGIAVWEDVLELRAGDRLADMEKEVKSCRGLLLLWTPAATESEWVEREVEWARQAREENPEYRIVVLLRGAGSVSARRLLGEELLFIPTDGTIEDAVPEIRRALGERAASGRIAEAPTPAPLLEEIVLSFSDLRLEGSGGRHRAAGRFRVAHDPAEGSGSRSGWQDFESPLGPIELEEIRWYLERYPGWPFGTFRERAEAVESKLRDWGRELYDLTLGKAPAQTTTWRQAAGHDRRVVIEVEEPGPAGGDEGAAALLALPWELLADEDGFLFEGGLAARVIRRIPRGTTKDPLPVADRLRVLLVIARPEEEGIAFLDPRASARPLIEALAPLGHRAELKVLEDGTFVALSDALAEAEKEGRPFQVVHFDGHGVYDKRLGLGKLCFENPEDARQNKLERRADLVDAERLGALLRDRRVPLFFLEACQTAKADERVTASVAARLLRAGVGSVIAMTHAVLVETARRFVGRFYQALAEGERIGTAMVAAERELAGNSVRGKVGGHGELELQDWFVPVLFQEEDGDLQLLQTGPMDPQDLEAQRQVREGELPPTPAHGFVGRARYLLTIQRLSREHRILTILGAGGEGKTALATESARWLLDLRLFDRVAFATAEDLPDARVMLDRLGHQLVPKYSVAIEEGTGTPEEQLKRARLPVERVLIERRVLLVVDNLESLLPAPGQEEAPDLAEVFELLSGLAEIGGTRLILTSREAPPSPIEGFPLRLGRLNKGEGRDLIGGVLATMGRLPSGGTDEKWLDELIETVRGHARSLVLLTPLVIEQGFQGTAESVGRLMAELEVNHPENRELSLLASIRISLDRLPEPARRQVRGLGVFHGSVHYQSLAHVVEIEPSEALALGRQLVDLGLADAKGPYLFPDPALAVTVASEISNDERNDLEERWFQSTIGLIFSVYQAQFVDAKMALESSLICSGEWLSALARAEAKVVAGDLGTEESLSIVTMLSQLFKNLGQPTTMDRLREVRLRLEQRLGEWSRASFLSAMSEVERLLRAGNAADAIEAANRLKDQSEISRDLYELADYDRGMAYSLLGQALVAAGMGVDALSSLSEAEKLFRGLSQAGNLSAARMLGLVIGRRGDALLRLGKLGEAVQCYEMTIEVAEEYGDKRTAAAIRGLLGNVRRGQGCYEEALDLYSQALSSFEALGEPQSVASLWFEMAHLCQIFGEWDLAEQCCQNSLRIWFDVGDESGQAAALDLMGVIYAASGRLEDAVQLHKQAAALREKLEDVLAQAFSLNNLASVLEELGRLDEARDVAIQAITLKEPFGPVAMPWSSWNILQGIELRADRRESAAMARTKAFELYAKYRREGGAPQSPLAQLIANVGDTLRACGPEEAIRLVPGAEKFEVALLIAREALLSLIEGCRDPNRFRDILIDTRHDYVAAVEFSLVLESLMDHELRAGPERGAV